MYVRLEKGIAAIFKSKPDWGGPHLCHLALNRLAGYVNDGILQTVVDQVTVKILHNYNRNFSQTSFYIKGLYTR